MLFRLSLHPRFRTLPAALLMLLAFAGCAFSQLKVELSFRRSLFIIYEPIIATVSIQNLSGRDLELMDEGRNKWFSFQIETTQGRLIPPYNADYQLNPVQIGSGETIKRQVNLTPLYPVSEFGIYHVRASIWDRASNRYFSSSPLNIEITEGHQLWEQTVGVPTEPGSPAGSGSPGETRTLTLLSHRLPDTTMLYLRIQDKEKGIVYCNHQLGRFVAFGPPSIELDASNNAYVLQTVAPRAYLLTKVGLNGEVLERKRYDATNTKPALRRDTKGGVMVVGGVFVDPNAPAPQTPAAPSISDRPVPLPTPPERKPPGNQQKKKP